MSTANCNVDVLSPVVLPCGVVLKNRIAKSAMTECLADAGTNAPNIKHAVLYESWRRSGAGLLISGNIMVDRRYLENPWNVVVEDERHMNELSLWATRSGLECALWAQISHPGRQCPRSITTCPVAPSPIAVKMPLPKIMLTPRALEITEIKEIIQRFANTARILKKAGFSGVQIHSAHGYLLSQFLSPLSNKRTDAYGGNIQNRSRFLLEVVREVRIVVGNNFPIGVKINSADFQRGGFDENDSVEVIKMLQSERVDLVEISGGNYEQPAILGKFDKRSERTRARESYFLEFAEKFRNLFPDIPLMITGGFRSSKFIQDVIKNGSVDVVGIARPFCTEPDKIKNILKEQDIVLYTPQLHILPFASPFDSALELYWHVGQMYRLAQGQSPDLNLGHLLPVLQTLPALLLHSKRLTTMGWINILFVPFIMFIIIGWLFFVL
eukprot:TRINITY_DN1407_c0_g1_i2.p1 TRINITY_DN1407_c0_g1~~TRINITY_DN1407_c0_g1_i2.p1  ORF type:complete len:440 (+),score=44.65 TRINITY_DN1407_c0_g1_i2:97-1416(+)